LGDGLILEFKSTTGRIKLYPEKRMRTGQIDSRGVVRPG